MRCSIARFRSGGAISVRAAGSGLGLLKGAEKVDDKRKMCLKHKEARRRRSTLKRTIAQFQRIKRH
jgi:hypothetical protein